MSDLNVSPVTDFGNLMGGFQMPTNQNQTIAQTALTNQQAQLVQRQIMGATIDNLQKAQQYKLFRDAVLDFSGQSNASGDQSTSGAPAGDGPPQSASARAAAPKQPTADDGDDESPAPTAAGGDDEPAPKTPSAGSDDVDMNALPGSPHPSADDLGQSIGNHVQLDAGLRQRFFVNPAGTDQEQHSIALGALSGNAGLREAAVARRDNGVLSRKADSERDANNLYDTINAVHTAPEGTAYDALKAVSKQAAAYVAKETSDPAERDEIARDTAAHIAATVHQYTGREVVADSGGTYRDKITGQPILDVPHAGATPEQFAKQYDEANSPVDVKNSDGSVSQVPKYKYSGFDNAAQYVHAQFDQTRAALMIPTVQAQFGQKHDALVRLSQAVAARTPQPGAPGAQPQPGAPGAQPGSPAADPVLQKALQDPEYKLQVPKVISGTSQSPAAAEQVKATVASRTELLKDSQDATSAAAQSMQYMQAAKSILDSKQVPTTGAYGALIAKASSLLPGQSVDASNYAEVAKYLGNAALAQAKGIYGTRMTQSEVGLQLNELSPSTKMPDSAIRDLLDTNIRSAQYTIDAARRSKQYLGAGGDPQKYADWLENYYPRAKSVNQPSTAATGAAPVKVQSRADALKLKPGTMFVTPDGRTLVR